MRRKLHARAHTTAGTGILLPVGFGDASSKSALGSLDTCRVALVRDVGACVNAADYVGMLHAHRDILLSLSLPNSQPTSPEQAFKDAVRETIILNGAPFSGTDALKLMRELERLTAPFAHNAAARAGAAMDILRAASRTCTGGDSYFGVSILFLRPGVVVTAGHCAARPIEVTINSESGRATIVSHNVYEVHDEEDLMEGDDGDGIITIDTVIEERIDCISSTSDRTMRVTSQVIESAPLEVRVHGAGTPAANGVYSRYTDDGRGWDRERVYYANNKGVFLSFRAIAQRDLFGGRVRLAESEWVIENRSKGVAFYLASVIDDGGEAGVVRGGYLDPPSGGWQPVKGSGALPSPTLTVVSRGYAPVEEDECRASFRDGTSNLQEEQVALEGGAGVDTRAASCGVEDMLTGSDGFVTAVSSVGATAEPILMPATASAGFPSFDPVLTAQGAAIPASKNRLRRPSAVVLRAAAAAYSRRTTPRQIMPVD
jgi:hypothetical protein